MRRGAVLLAVALFGCPPARVPPPTERIAAGAVDEALASAELAFAKRPDAVQVREAVRLFQAASLGDVTRVEGAIGTVRGAAWLLEHGAKDDRKALVEAAVTAGEQCQQRAPRSGPCDYWQAVALGLSAREKPLTALGVLSTIIELLKRADATAPTLDDAGPARVLSLLLVRAPGWPAGPGNPDDALSEAKKAVSRAPTHPLNELAHAECLAATGETAAAQASYQRAAELGRARGDADGAEWAAQAEAALQKLEP